MPIAKKNVPVTKKSVESSSRTQPETMYVPTTPPVVSNRNANQYKMLAVLIAGATLAAVLIKVFLLNPGAVSTPNNENVAVVPVRNAGGIHIADVDKMAFGRLVSAGTAPAQTATAGALGGGGGANMASSFMPSSTISVSSPVAYGMGGDSKMIAPGVPYVPINYRYIYKGEPLSLASTVSVYRRLKGLAGSSTVVSALMAVDGGAANLSRLQNADLTSFSLTENRDFGYIAYVDVLDGSMSFSQNWQRWPHPENACRDEACWQQYRLSPDDVPADDAVIALADAFITEYRISRDSYGTPMVNSQWRVPILMMAPGTVPEDVYVPDVVSVIYPLIVDGLTVTDDSGMESGITINVNVRNKRVDGAWGLATTSFQKSSYDAETDEARILKVLESGGLWGGWVDDAAKTVDVNVGMPTLILRRSWVVDTNGVSEEILVPSLRFPIQNPPAGLEWRKDVVVPLAKEILDEMSALPSPQPLMLESGTKAADTAKPATPKAKPVPMQ